ncbi:MAG TPA: AEC family transporter [Candidatus Akkermansia intestinigallinarum]|uniref:AEC family transporter n=1 Tax=Candidatus Akkermansia intestinigallinarum TaxID=2838431 RepID=A0A9D1VAQ7_9BACT|nr:AEC family transporter [Candidatus Akkermansia intestinigallinarum]
MWELIANSFLSTIPVFVFFAIGYRLRSQGSLAPEHDGPIMQLAMDVGYPCLIFYNIMKYMVTEANPTVSSVSFSLQALACGFLELFVGVLVAWLVAKALRLRIGTGLRTFSLTAGVQNYAFYVIPIIQMLFSAPGDPTMGVLFVHNMGCEIFVWSLGVILVCGGATGLRLGMLLRGPLLAVCLSLALAWSGLGSYVAQPPVMKAAEMIGNVATPVCLILFGCSMYDLSRHFVWQPRMLISGVLARLLIAPAAILLLAWLLPVDPLIKRIMVIQSAIPSAVVPVILAKRFGGVPEVGTQVLLATTAVSFITLPIWLSLGSLWVVPLSP